MSLCCFVFMEKWFIVDLYSQLWCLYLQCIFFYFLCTTWFIALLKLDSNVLVYRIDNSQLFCRNICFCLMYIIRSNNMRERVNFKIGL